MNIDSLYNASCVLQIGLIHRGGKIVIYALYHEEWSSYVKKFPPRHLQLNPVDEELAYLVSFPAILWRHFISFLSLLYNIQQGRNCNDAHYRFHQCAFNVLYNP